MAKKEPLYPHIPQSKQPGQLPTFKGYTVDFRLREFRKAEYPKPIEFVAFDSPKGRELLVEYWRTVASPSSRKFSLGQMAMTRGVANKVAEDAEFAKFVTASLGRHAVGDWGKLSKEDAEENELALKRGNLRIFSAYEHANLPKIWIITEADRWSTTVLFPEEY